MVQPSVRFAARYLAAGVVVAGVAITPGLRPPTVHATPAPSCTLANGVKHVIFIEFDNTHFMRDITRDGSTNVPSDLEQMPHLLHFIEGNGTFLSNDHAPLIAHTSDDIATSITGVYPSRNGVATSANSYYYYDPSGTPHKTSGFTYWTSKIGDGQYNFTSAPNTNAPAPWVPYTRAGCNVGAAAVSGFVLENTTTDLATAFPHGAPASSNPFADFVGVAVHCAAGNALCSSANGGVADVLPDEPNPDGSAPTSSGAGYQGYNALYGHKLLAQAIGPDHKNLDDINGHPIVDDFNGTLSPGFPGFSLQPQYALGYTADMQEHGIPVTYAYIITPHEPADDNPYGYGFPSDSNDYGPGEAHYVAELHQYDEAFAAFFARLAKDGIDQSNTLFVFTSDEGDHFIGGVPSPSGCDSAKVAGDTVTPDVACTYAQIGELDTNYDGLMQGEQGAVITSPVSNTAVVNNDSAPDLYLKGMPGPADSITRTFERATAALTVTNPLSETLHISSTELLSQYMANATEYKLLHMLTADSLRTPTFTAFAQPDYYVEGDTGSLPASLASCGTSHDPSSACVLQVPAFNWNHGDVQPQITTTWLGLVGPGVLHLGLNGPDPIAEAHGARSGTFLDHTDVRPTMLTLLGLQDDYASDGRVLIEVMPDDALPAALRSGRPERTTYIQLAGLYKQLNAPVGSFNLATLTVSTLALASNSSGDSTYTTLESELGAAGSQRDTVAAQILQVLNEAFKFQHAGQSHPTPALQGAAVQQLEEQANALLARGTTLASQAAQQVGSR
jgi:hypothetical protein